MNQPTSGQSDFRGTGSHPSGYTRNDLKWMGLTALCTVPFLAVRFFGMGGHSSIFAAAAIGLAIVAASFFLSWGVEALETAMPQAVALAILALIEVAPEYAIEAVLAFRQQTTLAAASMTGANRLLLGLGWPLILFVAWASARRRGQKFSEITLDRHQIVTVLFLLAASLYAFVIVVKSTLTLVDSSVLIVLYLLYIFAALRTGERDKRGEEDVELGVAARTKALPPVTRWIATTIFLGSGAFVLYFGAEPFIEAIIEVARGVGVREFVLIQWIAPFLSEFPESLTAFVWAAMITAAAMGLGNLLSSKLNQWTLLIATIPIAYSLGGGHVQTMHLTAAVRDEMFLTAAQSLFGTVLLLTLRFSLWKAWALLTLFLVQFLVPLESVHVIVAWVYVALTAGFLLLCWGQIHVRDVLRGLSTRA